LLQLSGTIFWSKLDNRQTYSTLRLGIKLASGGSIFVSINNPTTKEYSEIKSGNKVLITSGWLDIWDKEGGESEVIIKANGNSVYFYPKEKVLSDFNHIIIAGKILSYSGDTAIVQMVGDRNPKTNEPAVRRAKIKIGDSFDNGIINADIILEGKVTSVDLDGKSKLVIEANYDKTNIL
jgi:hypothetical protein